MLKKSLSTDLSTSAFQIVVEYDGVDGGGGGGGKLIEKLSKSRKIGLVQKTSKRAEKSAKVNQAS